MLSFTCAARLAPVITVLTLGFFKHHANAALVELRVALLKLPLVRNVATGNNYSLEEEGVDLELPSAGADREHSLTIEPAFVPD